MDKENLVNYCKFIEVGGQKGKGKTWTQMINDDLGKLRLQTGLTQNQLTWRKAIRETSSNPWMQIGCKMKMMMVIMTVSVYIPDE